MNRLLRISLLCVTVCLVSLLMAVPALALPSMPSSFYGTVKVNDANVADGTVIQALINGQAYAQGLTQTYQGNSVYTLDVKGDDPDTPAQDGGKEGDTIQFKIGGAPAAQIGTWHSGTNVELNLTAASSNTLTAPQASPTPIPTQTRIVILVQPSPTPTIQTQRTSAAAATQQASLAGETPAPSPFVPAAGSGTNSQQNDSSGGLTIAAIAAVVVAAAGGYWFLRRKM